jgi:ATP synthase protein I
LGRPEPKSDVSQGVRWATRATSIGLEFALPALLGGYLDSRWDTGSTMTIAGALLGFLAGMAHVLAIARAEAKTPPGGRGPRGGGADVSGSGSEPGSRGHG